MLHRVETTDPITDVDIANLHGKPHLVDRGAEQQRVIYFESEDTKRQLLDIPVEHPVEHRLNLDNPGCHSVEGLRNDGPSWQK
jgi:hypothetical protein